MKTIALVVLYALLVGQEPPHRRIGSWPCY